ncbi:phosphatidylinositol-glycan biosynthesis class X protein isoform X2 [Cynoglossus semilaevis]|uniref:Phosphatidylinositol-glycan biosynthesis class X protein n=1 Tax=Cynoglossus semilaevis TaxID=244447 RepID=A0A3P8UZY4_CYNSE|nr:phosphatidylinositol-glycan biosynthesis class X protein isoform X2 [Cynoglossus semilaevis]
MYFTLLFALTCLVTCHGFVGTDEKNESHCGLLKSVLDYTLLSVKMDKNGFHREVITTVQLGSIVPSSIRISLVYQWPKGVFIDPYQVTSQKEHSNWQILIDSAIDLEVPAHKTEGFVSYAYPTNGPSLRLRKVIIPIHGRYHEPSAVGKTFISVDIPAPDLLIRSDECTNLSDMDPHTVVNAPCTADNASICSWVKVHFQELGHMSFQLPVGDSSLVLPVCGGTLLVTLICCVVLSKYMWTHRTVQ